MPPKPTKPSKYTRQSTLKLDEAPPSKKQKLSTGFKILSAPPIFSLSANQAPPSTQSLKPLHAIGAKKDVKGKGKAVEVPSEPQDDRLWVDRFEPRSEEELAVHKRKVEDIRRWLQEAFDGGKLAKYRRFLVLTGPAGAGKTTTLRVLARSLEYEIVEWRNAPGDPFGEDGGESGMDKFEAFLARARAYRSVFAPAHTPARTLVLLEDLPNILHAPTRARFHAALRAHAAAGALAAPVVLVVSDAGVRGTHDPDMSAAGGSSARREEVVDVRVAVPDGLSAGVVTEIAFNPIAPTLLTPALKRLLERAGAAVPPGVLAAVVDGAGGDVRCAVMGLEFAWARGRGRKGRGKGGESAAALEAVTRRESGLVLFHLMGKVLYNKRKGDEPSAHLTVRDKAAERALDARLKDSPPLPPWLAHEERRTSRVDVDMLYAATPIDAGLFGLYIHQNYTLFCGEVDECAGVMDALSAVDAGGGENWYETNPYTFHLHALATLHALPAPVARTGQRVCKPAFFDALRRERETRAALGQFRVPPAELAAALVPRESRWVVEMKFVRESGGEVGKVVGERDVVDAEDADEGEYGEGGWRGGGAGGGGHGWLEDDDIEEW